jgi:hypothetical protein
MQKILTFGQYLNEARLFEISSESSESTVKVNGVELRTVTNFWGDQPGLGVSVSLDFSSDQDWENLIKAGLWSEKFFMDYAEDQGEGRIPFLAASKTISGANNHVDHYDAGDVYDMFQKKLQRLDGEMSPGEFAKMVNGFGEKDGYTDMKQLDDAGRGMKLAAYREFRSHQEMADTVKSISKPDLVKMARGGKELSPNAERAIGEFMKKHRKSRAEAIEAILNLIES